MSEADEILQTVPQSNRNEFMGREINRSWVEVRLTEHLLNYIDSNGSEENAEKHEKDLHNVLSQMTIAYNYQSSGTVGEVITRWMGLGLLKDFPKVTDLADTESAENQRFTELLKANDQYTLKTNVEYTYFPSKGKNHRGNSIWEFNFTKEKLIARMEEAKKEQEMWNEKYEEE
ncbi:hypothetical protein KW795_00480 [Candidatus Microgenomates bacterium]|nr:hypothetical protein [Candidatus Microgenomates bacterium]